MHPQDPREQHTTRYESGYQPGGYQDPAYRQDPAYYQQDPAYQPYRAPGGQQPAPRRRPEVNVGMFAGGVLATAIVTALAAWLCAWIIDVIATRATESGKFGVWNPMAEQGYWFAVVAFFCALLAGVLWYLLHLGTPSPDMFFAWIVGILIAAAVVIPLTLSSDIWVGVTTAIEHLVIGLPIFSLTRTVGAKSLERP
ncbi:hypothetical protein A5780_38360 [Nocardia sp. 852002-20019_SCH5090214]|uniref:Uncharacterized protein n=2 Tax=Nocardia TaxID=1817 RepID=A0A2T2Z6Z2_9NOCA|nr:MULTISPECIES: hypothetical protein [Nocardia]OBF83404.1 hypothetical protein A9X06_16660 [Mycobacterium sp. 852002-51759_SCH5129042]MBF6244096.1 hypothetical protein [Nocardia elegans]MBF6275037.1 hypothetical protein [Nocardia nova]MBF6448247.1 hypothetical protein [Nocardia elegans]MBV7706402.1 hypothetical protein [Nocardia nova]